MSEGLCYGLIGNLEGPCDRAGGHPQATQFASFLSDLQIDERWHSVGDVDAEKNLSNSSNWLRPRPPILSGIFLACSWSTRPRAVTKTNQTRFERLGPLLVPAKRNS